jgi:hypothetical protein
MDTIKSRHSTKSMGAEHQTQNHSDIYSFGPPNGNTLTSPKTDDRRKEAAYRIVKRPEHFNNDLINIRGDDSSRQYNENDSFVAANDVTHKADECAESDRSN